MALDGGRLRRTRPAAITAATLASGLVLASKAAQAGVPALLAFGSGSAALATVLRERNRKARRCTRVVK